MDEAFLGMEKTVFGVDDGSCAIPLEWVAIG
jgi:hypothetical protein